MKTILHTRTITDENEEEMTQWTLVDENGKEIADLNAMFTDGISECDWLDSHEDYLSVMYYDWDSNELFAIVDNKGKIVKQGIEDITSYERTLNLFIVAISGNNVEGSYVDYNMEPDDIRMAVIDNLGNFIIPPLHDMLSFDDEKQQFFAMDDDFNEIWYLPTGERA